MTVNGWQLRFTSSAKQTLLLSGLRPSLPDTNSARTNLNSRKAGPKGGRQDAWSHLEQKRRSNNYGYSSGVFVQPCLARTHPHKFVGNELGQPRGWPEGRKAGCLESFRTLVQSWSSRRRGPAGLAADVGSEPRRPPLDFLSLREPHGKGLVRDRSSRPLPPRSGGPADYRELFHRHPACRRPVRS